MTNKCTHRAIRSWCDVDGQPVDMWTCVDCGWRFEPLIDKKEASNSTEPVAWMVYTLDGKSAFVTDNPADFTQDHQALPLYTTSPQRKPLTDEQKLDLVTNWFAEDWAIEKALGLLRDYDIKQAHGIGEKK